MSEQDPLRHAAQYRTERDDGAVPRSDPDDPAAARAAEARRARDRAATRHLWVERQIREAMERGEFDDLPLAGRPIPGLDSRDPDWWLKNLVRRENITGVAPEAIQLRKDDAVLDARLDGLLTEAEVRAAVEEFDARVVAARRQLLGGPPVVTPPRDVEGEVARWHERRRARDAARRAAAEAARAAEARRLEAEQEARRAARARRLSGRWWRRTR
ncbi:DUF1992 domain-containing protein [Cellulomonas sp. PhB143]|uniref:DnaJ family domain-containing protein n=1 Tax=Cellulomonas sp. PhB143 TaxID=2485186 RepID=UPI000F489485|nr:DUF1992 domain-containing protein [Cellulomonas sp. PhB143]ROS75314.1 uncharacterized protein DUF1992 [Cellulomonas sp. PhB143]